MAINQINYRERFVCMIREDIVDFAMLLRAHFPTIRFVSIDTGERWVVASGSAEQRNVRWKPDHQPHALTYYEPDKVPNGFHAWLEPPGWRPIWLATSERITALRASGLSTQHSPEDMAGVYEIANVPRAQFAISGGYRIPGSSRPKYAVGSMLTQFAPGANEAVRFFNRAVRLLETISSNGMVFADPDIDADLVRPFQSHIWVGFHARRLILSDPEITISGDLRPSADDRPWMGRPYSALENEIAAEAKRPRSSDEVVRYQSLPLFLIEEDYAALLAAIRAAIPDVRIVPYLYDWHVEYRPYPDDRASHRAWFTPGKGTIEYLDRLDAPLHNRVYAWCEPPGWQPQWADPREVYRRRQIEDRRRSSVDSSLRCRAGLITNLPPQRVCFARARKTYRADWLRFGEIAIQYRSADAAMQAFFRRIAAIVAAVARPIEYCSHKPSATEQVRRPPLIVWTGPRAEQWLREDPGRCIEDEFQHTFVIDGYGITKQPRMPKASDALPGRAGSASFGSHLDLDLLCGNLLRQIQALDIAQRYDLEG